MHWFAKIAGWLQFATTTLAQIQSAGPAHGWTGWLVELGSLAAAIGIHAASNTDGTK